MFQVRLGTLRDSQELSRNLRNSQNISGTHLDIESRRVKCLEIVLILPADAVAECPGLLLLCPALAVPIALTPTTARIARIVRIVLIAVIAIIVLIVVVINLVQGVRI